MHYAGSFDERALASHPIFEGHNTGFRRVALVNHTQGSVHHGLSIDELAPGGVIDPHVHSFEEGFYILGGEAVVTIAGTSHRLRQGDYGAVKVGTPHAWRNSGSAPVRWLQMAAPQPKPQGAERDTFFPRDRTVPSDAMPLDVNNRNGSLLGHFDVDMIPPPGQRTTAAAGLEGVFLKWLIDDEFGARHHRLVFIEYQPGVGIGLHDHTFEEGYFILSGEVEATADGRKYRLKGGDVFWTGVGCVHAFAQVGDVPVRWLETFAPQPPKENVFRFAAEWDKKARELEG
jgi:quercetin dioxygenase-like cupin family protein